MMVAARVGKAFCQREKRRACEYQRVKLEGWVGSQQRDWCKLTTGGLCTLNLGARSGLMLVMATLGKTREAVLFRIHVRR